MRMGFRWFLMIAGLLLVPTATSFAQMGPEVPPVIFTGPLSNPRPESGGLYVGADFLYYRTNRLLQYQQIAVRGFKDFDGTASTSAPGTFVGSGEVALDTLLVSGPGQSQPGWNIHFGWRFENGVAVELAWNHLQQVRYQHSAGILPPSTNVGNAFADTFFFAPVYNFSTDWAGSFQNVPSGSGAATFGIWNAASAMSITFTQRYDTYSIDTRIPIFETADRRIYGLFGPRIVWIWERFNWRTVDADVNGIAGPDTVAEYSNMVSNRMYGIHFGGGNDWWLGNTPIGGFSFVCDIEGGLYVNLAKTHAQYARGDGLVASTRSGRLSSLVPSAEIKLGVKWYPWEGITVEAGYDVATYFNTISSSQPIDFNLGAVDPRYEHAFFRWYYGMRFGISFSF